MARGIIEEVEKIKTGRARTEPALSRPRTRPARSVASTMNYGLYSSLGKPAISTSRTSQSASQGFQIGAHNSNPASSLTTKLPPAALPQRSPSPASSEVINVFLSKTKVTEDVDGGNITKTSAVDAKNANKSKKTEDIIDGSEGAVRIPTSDGEHIDLKVSLVVKDATTEEVISSTPMKIPLAVQQPSLTKRTDAVSNTVNHNTKSKNVSKVARQPRSDDGDLSLDDAISDIAKTTSNNNSARNNKKAPFFLRAPQQQVDHDTTITTTPLTSERDQISTVDDASNRGQTSNRDENNQNSVRDTKSLHSVESRALSTPPCTYRDILHQLNLPDETTRETTPTSKITSKTQADKENQASRTPSNIAKLDFSAVKPTVSPMRQSYDVTSVTSAAPTVSEERQCLLSHKPSIPRGARILDSMTPSVSRSRAPLPNRFNIADFAEKGAVKNRVKNRSLRPSPSLSNSECRAKRCNHKSVDECSKAISVEEKFGEQNFRV